MEKEWSVRARFGPFELDPPAGELHTNGNGRPSCCRGRFLKSYKS